MNEQSEKIQKLILLKSKLEIAFEMNNQKDIVKYFNEFKSLYEQITSKKFESGISEEKLNRIENVINGMTSFLSDGEEPDEEIKI